MELYRYQKKVAKLLRAGRSIVLQAPTGAGKTLAALWPFLEAWDRQAESFPRKCVYVVPMRVLANQFTEATHRLVTEDMVLTRIPEITIQTGDQSQDPRFDRGHLIFCTIDQFLSSYLTMPYSLPRRLSNLNAGAMVGSYLVFDEFHLLEPKSTLPSVLYAIKQLRQVAPVLLMTATFSASMLNSLAEYLDAEVVLVPPEEARRIESREQKTTPRQRVWTIAESVLSAEAILDVHRSRSLALCNTVQRAQALYRELRQLCKARGLDTRILLLHSRFLPEDRRETEAELRRLFGKGEDADPSGSVIAIATQTIEVGVDITCETLHTELSPASSLIQRAGRCARYPGEQGQVIVYPVENYMPYGREKKDPTEETPWVKEMKAAFAWLQNHKDEAFDFSREQAFVDAVAAPRDERILKGVLSGRVGHREAIFRVLGGDRQHSDQRLLVRDADSRLVLIHPKPDALLKNPYTATGFSLQLGTLFGMFRDWQERGDELDLEWIAKRLIEDRDAYADKNEENRTEYDWRPLNDSNLLPTVRVLVVNPVLAGYLRDEGFVPDQGGAEFESALPPDAGKRTWEGYSYRLESYEEHIRLVLEAFRDLVLDELRFPARALDRAAHAAGVDWPEGGVLQAAWLVCLLHDVGKLSQRWQGWARAYQKQIGNRVEPGFAAAHTDSERKNPGHQAAAKAVNRKHPKPHHAGEGALAVASILIHILGQNELAKAALTAITRHHTPFARECQAYRLESQALNHIRATLSLVPEAVRRRIDLTKVKSKVETPPNTFHKLLIRPEQTFGWLAYTLLARALRRADQEGTQRGSRGSRSISELRLA